MLGLRKLRALFLAKHNDDHLLLVAHLVDHIMVIIAVLR